MIRAATLFSGIGAPEAARPDWHWLWHAEIEPFPAAVLAAHHPRSVNLGDVTAHDFAHRALAIGRPDVLVFGSPCQSFSVAGKRLGLDDPRGNLALVALAVVRRVRPRWLVFENVPGLLSSGGGDDFAAFLAAVQECGYLGCWRVLDARHWGLAQRRQRVFFVGCLGDWRGPAEVLSLAEGLRGYPETGREAGQGVARPLGACPAGGSGYRNDADTADNLIAADVAPTITSGFAKHRGAGTGDDGQHDTLIAHSLTTCCAAAEEDGTGCGSPLVPIAYGGNDTRGPIEVSTALNAHGGPHGRLDFESETFVATTLRSRDGAKGVDSDCTDTLIPTAYACQGSNVGEAGTLRGGNGHVTGGVPFVAHAFDARQSDVCQYGDIAAPLDTDGHTMAVAFSCKDHGADATADLAPTLRAMPHDGSHANGGGQMAMTRGAAIRRLTPVECERLQGFPDGHTAIPYRGKPAADGPRYRALGNSMAVPVVRWLLGRIEAQFAATAAEEDAA